MRRLGFALFVCLIASTAKADSILAANCAVTAALCADTPQISGSISTLALDYKGQNDGGYVSGNVTNSSYTYYDPTYRTTVSSAIRVGYDGIHGSSSITTGGAGEARFDGEVVDYFQVAGNVPAGTQLEVTYGADILSNTAASHSDFFAGLLLNSTYCISGYHYGDLTASCTAYIPIYPNTSTMLTLDFFTELDGSGTNPAFLDASNTAKFDAIAVVDAKGNPLSGVQLYDASGYDYNAPAVAAAAPEPSSLFLLGTGMATMAGVARRRMARFAMPVL